MSPGEDWREILRAAHEEPIDGAHYAAVRARVMAELARPRQAWRRMVWITGAAALAAAVLLALAVRRPALPALPEVAVAIPPAPAAPRVVARAAAPAGVRAARSVRPKREPLTIKLQTSDPNIVIYWIAE